MPYGGAVPFIIGDIVGLDHFPVGVIGEDGTDTFISLGYLVIGQSGSPAEGTLVLPD